MMRYSLGRGLYRLRSFAGRVMRIRDDVCRCVVFIGIEDTPERGGIKCCGTGFLVSYDGCRYLVTAQHIAVGIGDSPFLIRLNRHDGTADNIAIDPIMHRIRWVSNTDDPSVDIAVLPFEYDLKSAGYDVLYLPKSMMLSPMFS